MRKHPYDKLFDRKRKWSPVKPTAGKLKEGAEETILRALSIRHMELPVGAFISEGLEKSVPDNARKLLESNVEDEERHDLALGYIADVHNVNEKDEKENTLFELINFKTNGGKTRDFSDILNGHKAPSEIVYWRIEKKDKQGNLVKNIFMPNAPVDEHA